MMANLQSTTSMRKAIGLGSPTLSGAQDVLGIARFSCLRLCGVKTELAKGREKHCIERKIHEVRDFSRSVFVKASVSSGGAKASVSNGNKSGNLGAKVRSVSNGDGSGHLGAKVRSVSGGDGSGNLGAKVSVTGVDGSGKLRTNVSVSGGDGSGNLGTKARVASGDGSGNLGVEVSSKIKEGDSLGTTRVPIIRRELELAKNEEISDGRNMPTENGKPSSKFGDAPSKTGNHEVPSSNLFSSAKSGMPDPFAASRGRQLPTVIQPMSIDELLRRAVLENQDPRSFICDAADSFISSALTPLSELTESVDPAAVLRGICAPVSETPPSKCRVIHGNIPSDLYGGVYLRNGPNATSIHSGDGYHIFDGDGMLHAVSLMNGDPIYCSRFVETSRFRQEKEAGRPLAPKVFGGLGGAAGVARAAATVLRSMFGILDLKQGSGLSNTSVCYFNGQILSLSEDDMPYVIRVSEDGDISTVGRFRLPFKNNMCAHPKIDPVTGEMYAFSLNMPLPIPPFSFFRLSADGTKSGDVPVPLLDVPLVHDFAITARYVVFPDSQLVIRPLEMAKGAMPLVSDHGKTPRFCLLPRYALPEESPAAAMWFEAPGINCMHYINAWEEEDEVVIVAPVLSPIDRVLELNACSTLTEIRLNTTSGKVKTRSMCRSGSEDVEFGVVNPNFCGKKSRYVYLATGSFPNLTGVVKIDLSLSPDYSVVAKRDFSTEGWYGGEPFFVPAKEAVSEDDGYLLCFVGHQKMDVSELLIMDALSPSLRVLAAVELPSRVPAGFHGCFVTAEQLLVAEHRRRSR